MARTNFIQTSFRNGEWSPFSQGRIDDPEFYSALNLCADFIPVDAGALIRRSGTEFVATLDVFQGGTTSFVKLIPFDSDDGEHHVCVLLPGVMQFFSSGTFETEGAITISDVTKDNPAVFTTDAVHSLSIGDKVILTPGADTDVALARTLINTQFEIVTVPTTTTFTAKLIGARLSTVEIDGDDFCWHGGNVEQITELALPYDIDDLTSAKIKYTQDSDFLYLFHPAHSPRLIDEELDLITITMQDGPYFEVNTTTTTLTLSGTTGSVTVTASAVAGINGGLGFLSTDVLRTIRWQDPAGNWTWLQITAVGSTVSVTATILGDDASAGTGTITWRLGLYSDTTGHPTHGVFHELRLWLVSNAQTGRIDGSAIIDFKQTPDGIFSFEPTSPDGTVADDNAVSAIFNSTGRNKATWISADDTGLISGTSDGVWVIQASAQDDPITPTSIQARRKSLFKSSDALPALVNRSTIFVGDLEKEVIEIRRYEGGYDAKNVSRTGEHLTAQGLEEIYYANAPIPTLWGRTSDNQLIGSSFRRDVDGEQTGWHQHNLTFTLDPDKTATVGKVQSITVMKQSDKDNSKIDTLWTVVERNGFFCLEYMTPFFDESRIDLEGFFVDSGEFYDQSNFGTTWNLTDILTNEYTFYGLWHLEGNVVDVVFRTLDLGQQTVTNGEVTVQVAEEALLADASFLDSDNSTYRVTEFTESFAPGFVSDTLSTEFGGASTLQPPPNGGGWLEAGDGNSYYMSSVNGNSANAELINKDTGVATQVMSTTIMFDAIKAAGQDPTGIMELGAATTAAFILPGTQYFMTIRQFDFLAQGANALIATCYWKVNSPSDIEYAGGLMDFRSTSITIPYINNGQHLQAVSFFGQGRPLLDQIVIAYMATDDESYIARFAAITDQEGTFEQVGFAAEDKWELRHNAITTWGDNFFNGSLASSDLQQPMNNRAFFLPTQRGASDWDGIYLCSYVPVGVCQNELDGTIVPSNSYILGQAAQYPRGFITAVFYSRDPLTDTFTVGEPQIFNCRFRDSDANAVVPFADAGISHTGDPANDDFGDDYQCPTVVPVDPNDPNKPWMLFFPKTYYGQPDLEPDGVFMKVKVFEWSAVAGTAVETYIREGTLFDINAEIGVSKFTNNPSGVYPIWDQSTGGVEFLIVYSGAGIPAAFRFIVSDFGNVVIDVDTGVREMQANNRGFDAVIGLNYASQAQLLRPQDGSNAGPDLAKTRRVDQFGMILHRTGPFRAGTSFGTDNMDSFTPSEVVEETGKRPLFTGVFHDRLMDEYSFDGQIAWEMDRPGPGSFLAMGGFRNTQDR